MLWIFLKGGLTCLTMISHARRRRVAPVLLSQHCRLSLISSYKQALPARRVGMRIGHKMTSPKTTKLLLLLLLHLANAQTTSGKQLSQDENESASQISFS